jgi:NAD(P)-dependent dehydrogenase (short-subunit alcohol dehydrogenase family)
MTHQNRKTWLITGASRGFGRQWALAALDRGDQVAATARRLAAVSDLQGQYGDLVLPMALDVTDRDAAFSAVRQAAGHFGRLDVVVNNAGYGHFGMVEELSENDVRAQLGTNFFGALWVTQAALPILRAQRSGHLLQVTSLGGITAFPGIGAYHASKWALEGLSQSLAAEAAAFGIKVTMIEPGGYATDWLGPSSARSTANPEYDGVRDAQRGQWADQPGDPAATRAAILKVVDTDNPPLRIFFGKAPLEVATRDYESRLATWRQWQPLSVEAYGG